MSAGTAAILLTGSELLAGRVRDSNGHLLAGALAGRGLAVTHLLVAPDDARVIADDVRFLLGSRPAVLIVSGGLGTTHDDVTAAAVAQALGLPLVEDPAARAMVEQTTRDVAARRGLDAVELLGQTLKQARLPQGSRALAPTGVAPGFACEHDGTRVYVLPGVPRELEEMLPGILGELAAGGIFPDIVVEVLRIYGAGEIQVGPLLEAAPTDRLGVGITAAEGEITVTLTRPRDDAAAASQAGALRALLCAEAPVFSADGRSVDHIVADVLRGRGARLAVAESCTGGMLGARLTDLAGSSDYFLGGVVSYADEVKRDVLGVPAATLSTHGAVSDEVAAAMAGGVRACLGADFGLAVTGVAGPGGGSELKPVGLVHIACAGSGETVVRRHVFPGDRGSVRRWATVAALHLLRDALQA